jgi:hypothetical protein
MDERTPSLASQHGVIILHRNEVHKNVIIYALFDDAVSSLGVGCKLTEREEVPSHSIKKQ